MDEIAPVHAGAHRARAFGKSLPTKPHLEFQLAHARARNAVLHELNIPALQEALQSRGHEVLVLQSAAGNRPLYLQRPDKGRRLDLQSRTELEGRPKQAEPFDVVFVIGDGLSALAIEENATAFLDVTSPRSAQADGGLLRLSWSRKRASPLATKLVKYSGLEWWSSSSANGRA